MKVQVRRFARTNAEQYAEVQRRCEKVLRRLDPRFQAVVLVDADADPYRHWLRDLVTPLLQPGVGAVSGNRWYFPANGSLGGWCRFVYSGLALAPMQWFGLIWAGSLACGTRCARRALPSIVGRVFQRRIGRAKCRSRPRIARPFQFASHSLEPRVDFAFGLFPIHLPAVVVDAAVSRRMAIPVRSRGA